MLLDLSELRKVLSDNEMYRVTAYRCYNDNKFRKQGIDFMVAKSIIETINSLDNNCDRQCGFGSSHIEIAQQDNKLIVDYTYEPALMFYKKLNQRLVLEVA